MANTPSPSRPPSDDSDDRWGHEDDDVRCGVCLTPLGYSQTPGLRVRDYYCSDEHMEIGESAADEAAENNARGF